VQHPTFQQFWLVYKIAAKALRVVFAVPKISATCIYFFHSVNPFDLTKLSPPSRFLVTQLSLSEKRIARLGASIFDKLASTILELAPSLAIDEKVKNIKKSRAVARIYARMQLFLGKMWYNNYVCANLKTAI
jgi:hypothetical protein